MTVGTKKTAWEIAHELIKGLEYDAERTERGSGTTWSVPDTNAMVIDLGDRLEVTTENGNSVNIWITEERKREPELSYKVYLTRSYAVAALIHKAQTEMMTEDVAGVSYGSADDNALVPSAYHNKRYYCCVVTLKEHAHEHPTYELVIA